MTTCRMIQTLAVTAMVGGLAHTVAAQEARIGAKRAAEPIITMRMQSERTDTLPDPVLAKRWATLTANLLEDFWHDRRSPVANIEGDFSTLEMKIRLESSREDAWVTQSFTAAELLSADPKATAKALYDAATRKL
jgi:hypothetical protein